MKRAQYLLQAIVVEQTLHTSLAPCGCGSRLSEIGFRLRESGFYYCRIIAEREKLKPYFTSLLPFSRLHSGWSVKTANLDKWKQPDPMSTDEHEKILEVIEKAEAMERAEMQRVGYVREDEA